jgi:hypothetical protein
MLEHPGRPRPAEEREQREASGVVLNANNFVSSTGTTVSIDPTYGLDDDGTTSTATCSAACTKMSATSQAGKCCSCSGTTGTYVKSTINANTYLCQ